MFGRDNSSKKDAVSVVVDHSKNNSSSNDLTKRVLEISKEQAQKMKDEKEKREASIFKKEPRVNVIEKEEYEKRVEKVFHLLYETLSRSFGPYGAPTLIYNYPYSHVTKDGFTIMKNLSMDASDQLVDQAIANMASDICGRLNYSVGDGTTTAVIATNSIYQRYMKHCPELNKMHILPRDILQALNELKVDINEKLKTHIRNIQSENDEELYKNIYDVVYISSNGDKEISDYIASMYQELKFPGITCELSPDGITRKRIISGYKFNLALNDKLYINSDDNTMNITNADVVMFSVKITKNVYQNILKPLNEQSRMRGRKLLVCASYYDETALGQVIRRDLMNEYSKTKDINMVLCTYGAVSDHARTLASDFAMLTNTLIIDRELKASIDQQIEEGVPISQIFNIDDRNDITNLTIVAINKETNTVIRVPNTVKQENEPDLEFLPQVENAIRLGYVGEGNLGLKTSSFKGFYYDEARYTATLKDAEFILKDTIEKYKTLGTFNLMVTQAQQRLNALKLKMGSIEVGATSELSQKLLKDSVDDAIKAAQSSFDNGIVLGCNVHMIKSIDEVWNEFEASVEESKEQNRSVDESNVMMYRILFKILRGGFVDVYKTVLKNAFSDSLIQIIWNKETDGVDWDETIIHIFDKVLGKKLTKESTILKMAKNYLWKKGYCDDPKSLESSLSFYDLLVELSVENEVVFDISKKIFSREVVNSSQTDAEVLTATIDLIGLLMAGNQMLVTQKHNFD